MTMKREIVAQRESTIGEGLVKVHFELDSSDWHGHGGESLWAEPVSTGDRRLFRILNSPFFAKGINNRDIVKAQPTQNESVFEFEGVAERGGHSTYMLIMSGGSDRTSLHWNMLERLGCSYESTSID